MAIDANKLISILRNLSKAEMELLTVLLFAMLHQLADELDIEEGQKLESPICSGLSKEEAKIAMYLYYNIGEEMQKDG